MASGLRVWDAAGNLTLDTSTRTGRVIGLLILSAGAIGSLDIGKAPGERVFAIMTLTNSDGQTGYVDIRSLSNVSDEDGPRIYYEVSAGTGAYIVYGLF
jgi:hypothetical protein